MLLCLPMADTLRAPVLACHVAVLSSLPQMLLYLPLPLPHLSSSLASLLPFSSCFPQHLISLFCSVESHVWFLTFPQWHLKCFLVQNILFIAIETGSSVWKKRKKKVWEPAALQFCYFAQIHKWQHAGRYAKACCLRQQEKEGPPISRKLAQVCNPG